MLLTRSVTLALALLLTWSGSTSAQTTANLSVRAENPGSCTITPGTTLLGELDFGTHEVGYEAPAGTPTPSLLFSVTCNSDQRIGFSIDEGQNLSQTELFFPGSGFFSQVRNMENPNVTGVSIGYEIGLVATSVPTGKNYLDLNPIPIDAPGFCCSMNATEPFDAPIGVASFPVEVELTAYLKDPLPSNLPPGIYKDTVVVSVAFY